VALGLEGFENSKNFLVVCIIIEFSSLVDVEMKCDWVDFFFFCHNQWNNHESIVGSISFYNNFDNRWE